MIEDYVLDFIKVAWSFPDVQFELTAIGCGLAGYKPADIAPFFEDAPSNVELPDVFKQVLTKKAPPN